LKLFVYGTLAPDAGTPMGDWIAARLIGAEPATAPGRLFGVRSGRGWYPALLPPRSSARASARVAGVLCELRLRAGDLARLDRYEGAEYRRVSLPVRTATGRRCMAQLYLWRIGRPRNALSIPAGDFARWLRLTRRRPFSTPYNAAMSRACPGQPALAIAGPAH
jgi:gamma-glutamylcyclotransferase (GGCT)/AIG2-like uncharacterized protein YtfP